MRTLTYVLRIIGKEQLTERIFILGYVSLVSDSKFSITFLEDNRWISSPHLDIKGVSYDRRLHLCFITSLNLFRIINS